MLINNFAKLNRHKWVRFFAWDTNGSLFGYEFKPTFDCKEKEWFPEGEHFVYLLVNTGLKLTVKQARNSLTTI